MATADLGIRIFLQDGASAGLSSLNGRLGGLGYQIGRLGYLWSQMDGVTKVSAITAASSGIVFAGFAGALGYVIKQGESLQDTLIRIGIAVKGAGDQGKNLESTLIQVADNSIFSISQVGDAFVALGEHEFTAQQIMDGLGNSAIVLAEAIGSSPVDAANLLSSTLLSYKLNASDAKDVTNLLTGAFYNGIPSVSGLNDALATVAPQAVLLHIPLLDIVTALDLLGQAGFSGAEAGTALRNMLANLSDPTTAVLMQLQHLGIVVVNDTNPALQALADKVNAVATKSEKINLNGTVDQLNKLYSVGQKLGQIPLDETFYQWATQIGALNDQLFNAQGQFIGLPSSIQKIADAIKPLSNQDQLAAVQALFNIKGGKGAQTLVNDFDAADFSWNKFQQDLKNANAQNDADQKTNSLSASVKRFITTLGNAAGAIGLNLLQPLTNLVNKLNDLVTWLTKLSPHTQKMIGEFLVLGAVHSGVLFGLSSFITAFRTVTPLIKDVGSALNDATRFAGPLKFAFGTAGRAVKDFGGGLSGVANGIIGLPLGVMGDLLHIGPSAHFAKDALGLLTGGFRSLGFGIMRSVISIGSFGIASLSVIGPILIIIGVIVLIVLLFTKFRTQAMAIVDVLRDTFLPVWNNLRKAIEPEIKSIGQTWNEVMPQISKVINQQLIPAFVAAKPGLEVLGKIFAFVGGLIVGIVAELVKAFIKAMPFIVGVISSVIRIVGDLGQIIKAVFRGQWGQALGFVKQLAADVFGLVINYLKMVWAFVSNFVVGVINWFKTLFDKLVGHSIVTDGMKLIHDVVTSIFNIISAFIKFFVAVVIGYFNLWVDAIKLVVSLITGHFNDFKGKLTTFYNDVNNNVIQPIVNAFQNIWNAIKNGVNSVLGDINNLKNTLLDLYNSTIGKLGNLLNTIGGLFSNHGGGGNKQPHVGSHAAGYITNGPEYALIGEGGEREIVTPVSKLIAAAQIAMMQSGMFGNGSNQNNQPVIVNNIIDGKLISKTVTKGTRHDLQMNGFGRFRR